MEREERTAEFRTMTAQSYEYAAEMGHAMWELEELIPGVGRMRQQMEGLVARARGFDEARATIEAMMAWLRAEMAERERRMQAWY